MTVIQFPQYVWAAEKMTSTEENVVLSTLFLDDIRFSARKYVNLSPDKSYPSSFRQV